MIIDVGMLWGQITERTVRMRTLLHMLCPITLECPTQIIGHSPEPSRAARICRKKHIYNLHRLDMQLIYVRCYYPYFTLGTVQVQYNTAVKVYVIIQCAAACIIWSADIYIAHLQNNFLYDELNTSN